MRRLDLPEVGGRVQRVDKVKHTAERVAGREATLGAASVRQTQAHLQVWTSVNKCGWYGSGAGRCLRPADADRCTCVNKCG